MHAQDFAGRLYSNFVEQQRRLNPIIKKVMKKKIIK